MLDRAGMQTPVDEERIRYLGARKTEVLGNMKFDEAVPQADPTDWLAELGFDRDHPIIVVGSTRSAMEEQLVVGALPSGVQVVHAPRHVERAEAVANQYADKFGRCFRRSLGQKGSPMVLDSYGELGRIFAIADLVVIGGGFDNLGGQNLLQPLAHGKPVLHGPNMQNFAAVAKASVERGASMICRNSEELAAAISQLLSDASRRIAMGEAAKAVVAENAGATQRYADAIIAELVS
jgi:3-deoxy-D-manno-octulosonic-acid transferase